MKWVKGWVLCSSVYFIPLFTLHYLFLIALGLCCCSRTFSSCGEQELLSSCGVQASHCSVFSCCRAQALGHAGFGSYGMWAQWLWRTGLVAPWHVGSFWTRDQICVPCLGRWILNHWPPGKSRMSKMRVTGEKEFLGTAELELVLSIILIKSKS